MLDFKKKTGDLTEAALDIVAEDLVLQKNFKPSLNLPTPCDSWRIGILQKALRTSGIKVACFKPRSVLIL